VTDEPRLRAKRLQMETYSRARRPGERLSLATPLQTS
jgi:hypothetical protein